MFRNFKSFLKDESGATFIEYGAIAGLIGVAIILAIGGLVTSLDRLLLGLADVLDGLLP